MPSDVSTLVMKEEAEQILAIVQNGGQNDSANKSNPMNAPCVKSDEAIKVRASVFCLPTNSCFIPDGLAVAAMAASLLYTLHPHRSLQCPSGCVRQTKDALAVPVSRAEYDQLHKC